MIFGCSGFEDLGLCCRVVGFWGLRFSGFLGSMVWGFGVEGSIGFGMLLCHSPSVAVERSRDIDYNRW